MVSETSGGELPIMAELPRRKVRKSILDTLREFQDISSREHGLVPLAVAATILGLSRQRVHDLVKEGTLVPIEAYGKKWLSGDQLKSFVQLKREPGRPWKEPSLKELWKASFEEGKAILKSPK
jgi:hypothetical protein